MKQNLKYSEITEKIIGCAMKVHQEMRNGFSELIYSRCMTIEFERIGLKYVQEPELVIYYEEYVVGKRKVDFMIEEKILLELKAITDMGNKELYQALGYLESHRLETGLLINFGSKSLQFKRLINPKINQNPIPVNP
jgi:GxxExxY protein